MRTISYSILKVVVTLWLVLLVDGCSSTGIDVCWHPQAKIQKPQDVNTVNANIHVAVIDPSKVRNGLILKGKAPPQIVLRYREGQGEWQYRHISLTPDGKSYDYVLPVRNVEQDLEYVISVDGVIATSEGRASGPYIVPIRPGPGPDVVYKEALEIGKKHVRGRLANMNVVNRIRRSKDVSVSNAEKWKSGYIDGYVRGKLEVYPDLDENLLRRDAENEYNALSRI